MSTPERQLKPLLAALASHFQDRGWTRDVRVRDSLRLCCEPSHGVQHSLRLWEPVRAAVPAPLGQVYVRCKIFFSFVAVQRLINESLGYEQHEANMVSASISLNELVPGWGMDDFRPLELEPDASAPGILRFLNDYDRWMAPLQSKLAHESVLLDPDFRMPSGEGFSWYMRRLAYLKLAGTTNQWCALADEVEGQARGVLDEVAAPYMAQPGIFTNAEAILRDYRRRSADEALHLVLAMRREAS